MELVNAADEYIELAEVEDSCCHDEDGTTTLIELFLMMVELPGRLKELVDHNREGAIVELGSKPEDCILLSPDEALESGAELNDDNEDEKATDVGSSEPEDNWLLGVIKSLVIDWRALDTTAEVGNSDCVNDAVPAVLDDTIAVEGCELVDGVLERIEDGGGAEEMDELLAVDCIGGTMELPGGGGSSPAASQES